MLLPGYSPSSRPSCVDKIISVAEHLGVTDAELDFIINNQIKCRLGHDAEGVDK